MGAQKRHKALIAKAKLTSGAEYRTKPIIGTIEFPKVFPIKEPNKSNYPPKKCKTQEQKDEWLRKKNIVKPSKTELKADDQNYGTHDMKGRYIKKITKTNNGGISYGRYKRWTKNPRTPGRETIKTSKEVRSMLHTLNEYEGE